MCLITDLLPFLGIPGKLLESQICINIDNHLRYCNLISSCQWGFTKGLSTEGKLLTMTERWKTAIDSGLSVGAISNDRQKAFDTVSHNFLTMKLHAVAIFGNLHTWLMSYLTNRQQFTELNGIYSSTLPIAYGVPQGSSLGPRLYYKGKRPSRFCVCRKCFYVR